MSSSRLNPVLDYFPLLAYLGFWLQGAAIGAVITGDPRLIKLGLVTIPALLALLAAFIKIRRRHLKPPAAGKP
jgi:predicted branched-subunit amino acid permease